MRLWLLTHRSNEDTCVREDHVICERLEELLAAIIEHWGDEVAILVYRAMEGEMIDVACGMVPDAIGKKLFPGVRARVQIPPERRAYSICDEELEVLTIETTERQWFGCLENA
jgi:hypothetical protein